MKSSNKVLMQVSQSLTSSTKTEMILMKIKEEGEFSHYFVEYPTNKLPDHRKLEVRGNTVVPLTPEDYLKLLSAFETYEYLQRKTGFLHAPSFIIGSCSSVGLCLYSKKILL